MAPSPPNSAQVKQEGIDTLKLLQNSDASKLMDLVDDLRDSQLELFMGLPQLVVCGDQSAGKSAVLEAITQVPFPSKSGFCTRFATQIALRRAEKPSISSHILPDPKLKEAEQERLRGFEMKINGLQDLGKLVEAATEHMGLDVDNSNKNTSNSRKKATVSRSVLSIEIAGPTHIPLTLVDLPGWINSATKLQTTADKDMIQGMIKSYLKQERTVALAVVSATNDLAVQSILSEAAKVDREGKRTLGVITKPDEIIGNAESVSMWSRVARNEEATLELGWHMLRNLKSAEKDKGMDRGALETSFFEGAFKDVPDNCKGIESLRSRLSDLIYGRMKQTLPTVLKGVNDRYKRVDAALKQLGEPRSDLPEQKKMLITVAMKFNSITRNAVNGTYDDDFFDPTTANASSQGVRYLRGKVSDLQEQFMLQMQKYGHKFRIYETADSAGTHSKSEPDPQLSKEYEKPARFQKEKTRQEAVRWAQDTHVETRGDELQGNFNTRLVSLLFHEESEPWAGLAKEHLHRVAHAINEFVFHATKAAAGEDTLAKNLGQRIEEVVEDRLEKASRELSNLLEDQASSIRIFDPAYAAEVQKRRDHKLRTQLKEAQDRANGVSNSKSSAAASKSSAATNTKIDGSVLSAESALDHMLAFQSIKQKTFSENVTQQVIERHLLKDLADDMLSTQIVLGMSDEEIRLLAAEPPSVSNKRNVLLQEKEILIKSKRAFDKVLYPNKRDSAAAFSIEDDEMLSNGMKRRRLTSFYE